jgi:hypothetical protein
MDSVKFEPQRGLIMDERRRLGAEANIKPRPEPSDVNFPSDVTCHFPLLSPGNGQYGPRSSYFP